MGENLLENQIVLPSKTKIISEDGNRGVYEIGGFYPGYGYTIGNSLRRIILSSLSGAAVTAVKIEGAEHEFTVLSGVKEDVIRIILNIKRLRIKLHTDESLVCTISKTGEGEVTGKDITCPTQMEILSPDMVIATLTDKKSSFNATLRVRRGIGFVSKDQHTLERVNVGDIVLDANFTPIRQVSYEVENMRVGNRTDFNKLRMIIETDGSVTPKQALENSINIMIQQLTAITGFVSTPEIDLRGEFPSKAIIEDYSKSKMQDSEFLKTRIENLTLSSRTLNALTSANIRTIGGLARKKEKEIMEIEGLGAKGVAEIRRVLSDNGISLK